MGDIVMFTPEIDKKAWAEEVYNVLLEADKAVIAIEVNGEVQTGYFNCTNDEKLKLISKLQIDTFREILGESMFD